MRQLLLGGLLSLVSLLVVAVATQASDDSENPPEGPLRLGGHRFIPLSYGFDPLVRTYVRTSTGFGEARKFRVPFRNLDGERILELEGDLVFLVLEMEYQHAIREWLAVRGIVTGVARTGTNEQSLLSHGLAAVNGYGIGALVRLWRNERMMISASADMKSSSLYSVSPYRFVKTVFENGGFASAGDNSLLVEDDSVRNSFGGSLAYALNKWVGFTLIAQTGVADPFEEKENTKWLFTGGVAASIDFGAGTPLPVGVSIFYVDDSFPANGNDVVDNVRTMGVTLAYTGREDFSIGADTTFQRLPLAEGGGTIDGVLFRLKLSYYF